MHFFYSLYLVEFFNNMGRYTKKEFLQSSEHTVVSWLNSFISVEFFYTSSAASRAGFCYKVFISKILYLIFNNIHTMTGQSLCPDTLLYSEFLT